MSDKLDQSKKTFKRDQGFEVIIVIRLYQILSYNYQFSRLLKDSNLQKKLSNCGLKTPETPIILQAFQKQHQNNQRNQKQTIFNLQGQACENPEFLKISWIFMDFLLSLWLVQMSTGERNLVLSAKAGQNARISTVWWPEVQIESVHHIFYDMFQGTHKSTSQQIHEKMSNCPISMNKPSELFHVFSLEKNLDQSPGMWPATISRAAGCWHNAEDQRAWPHLPQSSGTYPPPTQKKPWDPMKFLEYLQVILLNHRISDLLPSKSWVFTFRHQGNGVFPLPESQELLCKGHITTKSKRIYMYVYIYIYILYIYMYNVYYI